MSLKHCISLFWFLAVSAGHAAIWVRIANWLHGTRPQYGWMVLVRFLPKVVAIGLPMAFFIFFLPGWWQTGYWHEIDLWMYLYFTLCAVIGLLIGPALTLERWLKAEPKSQVNKRSELLNLGKQAVTPLHGSGRRGWMAHLPLNQAFHLELIEREVVIPGWPSELDGFRLLHISDLHFWGRPDRKFYELVVEACSKRQHDLVLITGDIVDSPKHYDWLEMLIALRGKSGSYFILGNHDSRYDAAEVRKRMRGLSYKDLGGRSLVHREGNTSILLCGNEMPWLSQLPEFSPDSKNLFRICLSHSPDQWRWGVRNGIQLMFCGHNHGGQIRIPGIGSIFVPSKTGRRFDYGLFQVKNMMMHVSRGLSGGHPIRYFCPPEVTWLTLRCDR